MLSTFFTAISCIAICTMVPWYGVHQLYARVEFLAELSPNKQCFVIQKSGESVILVGTASAPWRSSLARPWRLRC